MADKPADRAEYTDDGLSDAVKAFLSRHKGRDGNRTYLDAIDGMMPRGDRHIVIDYNDLVAEPEIEGYFHREPDRILDAFATAIQDVLRVRQPGYAESIRGEVRARIANCPMHCPARKIDVHVIGRITSVSGMVVRASEVKPLARELVYRCPDNHKTAATQTQGMTVNTPAVCADPDCKHRNLTMVPKESHFVNFQVLRLQELPEDLPPGQIPHYMDINIKQDLVDAARPGDRIVATGIMRIEEEPVRGVAPGSSALHRLRMEGNNIEFLAGKARSAMRPDASAPLDTADVRTVRQIMDLPDPVRALADSFAAHVSGHRPIKEILLYALVGAPHIKIPDGPDLRGDIHMFLVGDPGTAKSEMLKFCARITPLGTYTSGKGSTAAGLTAAVVKDKTGMMMLESGAMVMSDQGVMCADEFDKLDEDTTSALHEAMEQQTVSVTKGGIVATLNARTAVLAAANPKGGRYDPNKTIIDNISTPIPLVTRFAVVWVVRDVASPAADTAAADIILRRRHSVASRTAPISPDTMRKYIQHAKTYAPEMSAEADAAARKYYLDLRKMAGDDGGVLVTPRRLEDVVRMAQARARLYGRPETLPEDVERAIQLMELALRGAADVGGGVDPRILHGKGSADTLEILVHDMVKELAGKTEDKIIQECTRTGKLSESDVRRHLGSLERSGRIVRDGDRITPAGGA